MYHYNHKDYERFKDVAVAVLPELFQDTHGERIALHLDGVVCVMEQNNYHRDECASVKCSCIHDLDMSHYRDGWDSIGLSDQEVITTLIKDGDMSPDVDYVVDTMLYSLDEARKSCNEYDDGKMKIIQSFIDDIEGVTQ